MSGLAEREIGLELIDVVDRLRETNLEEADKLAVSMKDRGLITPVLVRPADGGRFKLVAGAHRFAAAYRLGWPTIRAIIEECDDDEARLREIDENLYRHELTPYDQANFLAERRQIWERLNGRVKPGRDKRKSRQVGAIEERDKLRSFYSEVGDLFSLPKRTVQRALERKRCIIPAIWEELRGKPEATNGALLDKLADLEPAKQQQAFDFARSSGNSFAFAVSYLKVSAAEKPAPTVTQMIKKIQGAWAAWDAAEREIFMRQVRKLK